ncbi:iron-sulfur cluster assembly accessory protein [Xanthobacter dioxanivorans]|uniref:Iron-sulfur cluster assembly accessory protein n=1 Tax=Xanthobacter dioxanivorans TaxID=2528964 RepID=A0A974PQZ5_9HYPH|nr:iron-sulfur cluster assembly accessory protein [Xanthobacter dioxanivorans]QRG07550.1 iron-sulfur cluster assembly accessory protein [Xanthobacter dioxanivorans]
MITLTTSAVAAVKVALSRAADAEGVRVVAAAGAHQGVRYLMHLENAARDGDTVIELAGVKVFIDGPSRAATQGIRIDFAASGGFVVEDHPAPVAPAGSGLRH